MESTTEVPVPVPAPGSPVNNARIATAFLTRFSLSQLAVAVSNILAALTGNAAFPNPRPTLAEISAAHDTFVAKIDLAAGGGRVATAQLADARVGLVRQMHNLALNLQQASNGDRTKLVSTGFPLRRGSGGVGPLPAPVRLRLARGPNSGQLIARCGVNGNAKAYQWRYATAQAPTVWIEAGTTTKAQFLLVGLALGNQYIVQARLVGAKGASDWSDGVMMFAT
jgi:hypothetical protein